MRKEVFGKGIAVSGGETCCLSARRKSWATKPWQRHRRSAGLLRVAVLLGEAAFLDCQSRGLASTALCLIPIAFVAGHQANATLIRPFDSISYLRWNGLPLDLTAIAICLDKLSRQLSLHSLNRVVLRRTSSTSSRGVPENSWSGARRMNVESSSRNAWTRFWPVSAVSCFCALEPMRCTSFSRRWK